MDDNEVKEFEGIMAGIDCPKDFIFIKNVLRRYINPKHR